MLYGIASSANNRTGLSNLSYVYPEGDTVLLTQIAREVLLGQTQFGNLYDKSASISISARSGGII